MSGHALASDVGWKPCDLEMLIAKDIAPIPWLVEGLLAEGECLIVTAPPKAGKTYVGLQLVLDLALGRPAFGQLAVPRRCRCMWIDEEMGERQLQRRLQRLALGAGLTREQIHELASNVRLYPQQGFRLYSPDGFEEYKSAIEALRPDFVAMDSLIALQGGEENKNTDRRRFYNHVVAPYKGSHGCAFFLTAHPPLPPSDAPYAVPKRPRGAGDSLAFTDRARWLDNKGHPTASEHGEQLELVFEETHSREGGGVRRVTLYLEDTVDGGIRVRQPESSAEEPPTATQVDRYAEEIKRLVKEAGGEIYQPELWRRLEERGLTGKQTRLDAMHELKRTAAIEVGGPRPGEGTGKWVTLIEEG